MAHIQFIEEALTMLMQRTMSLHGKPAEERYKELLQIPDFMQRIPLKFLASFPGKTDTSLSRIRKKNPLKHFLPYGKFELF